MLSSKLHFSIGNTDRLYVDDVFSTYLYTGNGSTQTINNGIDLAGKGGMVWLKNRTTGATSNNLQDTARGRGAAMFSDTTNANIAGFGGVSSFNSNGFTLDNVGGITTNNSGQGYASWTFRKSPRFFDVVTYTGNGASSRAISHSLGQEVGMVMTKATSTTGDWNTYHRSATGDMVLNTTAAQTGSKALVNSATATTFTVSGAANTNAVTYVAYLFAHDTSADGIIQCGSYTGNGSTTGPIVNLGWEPQYLMIKNASGTGDWQIIDSMRGMPVGSADATLQANLPNAESSVDYISPTATGFQITSTSSGVNTSGSTYIYLAIRRHNKPPTTGTQVYNAIARTGNDGTATFTGVGFAPDLSLTKSRTEGGRHTHLFDRLRGASKKLSTGDTAAESLLNGVTSFGMDGVTVGTDSDLNASSQNYINHFFKRAPGFFDVVCDTGTGSAHAIAHSLTVVPELMIRKKRSTGDSWVVYAGDATDYLFLNGTAATADLDTMWNDTTPTASAFTVGTNDDVNQSAGTFVTYLFATKEGISKVGSYTGNGSSQTVPCGFTTGARFILIKRTDSAGDWYVWDTARGVVAGNDPHLSLNTTAAEVTSNDSIDPNVSGFIVNQVAATNINVNAATYIFLAVS